MSPLCQIHHLILFVATQEDNKYEISSIFSRQPKGKDREKARYVTKKTCLQNESPTKRRFYRWNKSQASEGRMNSKVRQLIRSRLRRLQRRFFDRWKTHRAKGKKLEKVTEWKSDVWKTDSQNALVDYSDIGLQSSKHLQFQIRLFKKQQKQTLVI